MARFNQGYFYLLDEVLCSVAERYFYTYATEDDRRQFIRVCNSILKYINKYGGETEASLMRAETRSAIVFEDNGEADGDGSGRRANNTSDIDVVVARAKPLQATDLPDPVDRRNIEAFHRDIFNNYARCMVEVEFDVNDDGSTPSDDLLDTEALVQYYGGNILRPSLYQAIAEWFLDTSIEAQDEFIAMCARLSSFLSTTSISEDFPWRRAVFARFAPDVALFEEGDSVHTEDGESSETFYEEEVTAGASTHQLNLRRNDALNARFDAGTHTDAHSASTLQASAVTDGSKRAKPATSIYGADFAWKQPVENRNDHSERKRAAQAHSLQLGLWNDNMVTTYTSMEKDAYPKNSEWQQRKL